jgi:hypothetical protein
VFKNALAQLIDLAASAIMTATTDHIVAARKSYYIFSAMSPGENTVRSIFRIRK